MDEKYLLFVDDLKDQQLMCKDAVRAWNEAHATDGRKVVLHGALTLAEGINLMKHIRFDAAFVDLKMPGVGKNSSSAVGNKLAHDILFKAGLPIAIISGNLADLDPSLTDMDTIETFNKGKANVFADALNWLEGHWMMMTVMSQSRSAIREVSAEVFAQRLWPFWARYLDASSSDPRSLVPMVARQYVWHLSEVIGDGGSDRWHPFENWICPAKDPASISTGDLFRLGDELWLVLTPPCDLANRNVDDVLLAYCDQADIKQWDASVTKLHKTDPGDAEATAKAEGFFRPYLNQNFVSQHFLAPLPDDPARPMLVKFNKLKMLPLLELEQNLEARVATVSAPFVSNLCQRFGAYAGRMGQPNIDPKFFPAAMAALKS